jgi:rubredoxin
MSGWVVTQGMFLAWAPFAAVERGPTDEVGPDSTYHAQLEPRRRALCGYKRKDLRPAEIGWDDVPEKRRCPDCHAAVGSREFRAAEAMASKIRRRLEIIEGVIRALPHLAFVDQVKHEEEDEEAALARLAQPPLSLTKTQAIQVLDLPRWPLTDAARRQLETERGELVADLEAGPSRIARPGRIDMARPILLIVSEEWATATKRRRDHDSEAILPIKDEPGPDDETSLRRALDFDPDDLGRLRYHQFCIVAPADHPIRSWALRFFDTHLPGLVTEGAVFACAPLYDRAQAQVFTGSPGP